MNTYTIEERLMLKKMNQDRINDQLVYTCMVGNLEYVKYLLTSPELKKHPNVHAYNEQSLKNSCLYGHLNIVEYLIFDCNLEKTKDIEDYLILEKREDVISMFSKRELKEGLQNTLNNDHSQNMNMKMKI